jgi:prevent-host-death family protein
MDQVTRYGLEQARAQLPHIAAEASAGHSSVITRHGKPVAVVVPMDAWQVLQGSRAKAASILALRGTGRKVWPDSAGRSVAVLRNEWQ